MFIVGIVFSCLIVIPYAWFAMRINTYSHENKPEDFSFPTYSMLWITALSTLFFQVSRRLNRLLRPYILRIIPTQDKDGSELSDEERQRLSEKIEDHFHDGLFYTISSIWGMYVCMGQEWLPWYMGGDGDFELSFQNVPFFKCDDAILTYGLVGFGFRIDSLVNHLL